MMVPGKTSGPTKSMIGLKRPLLLVIVNSGVYRGKVNFTKRERYGDGGDG